MTLLLFALGRTKRGKAMGAAALPVELIEALGTGYFWERVVLAQRSASDRAPFTRRGGWMFHAPRKPILLMAVNNAWTIGQLHPLQAQR